MNLDEPVLSGVARALSDEELAGEVARQMLGSLKAQRGSSSLAEAVRVGLAAEVSMAEMERMSGYTRPTLYAAKRQLEEAARPVEDTVLLIREVLIALGAVRGTVPVVEVARRLRLSLPDAHAAVSVLASQDLCAREGPTGGGPATMSATITPAGMDVLRAMFDDLYLRRHDAYAVYLRVDPADRGAIDAAAAKVISRHEHTLLDISVAPSRMVGPELALSVHAPSARVAVSIAHDIWREVREVAGLETQVAWLVNVIPPAPLPASESAVLDAFVEALVAEAPDVAGAVSQARMRFAGGIDERQLAGRCVTAAAIALRRAAGNQADPRPISDGELAAEALMPAHGVPVAAKYASVKRATVRALELAADRLGPFRGGELGSFRAPSGRPRVVAQVSPTEADLIEMATDAGRAVGNADKLGLLDAAKQTLAIIAPQR